MTAKRTVLAGIVGGLVLFAVMTAVHVSPLGRFGVDIMPREVLIVETLSAGAGGKPGFYRFPADPAAGPKRASGLLVYFPTNRLAYQAWKSAAEGGKDVAEGLLLAALMAGLGAARFLPRWGLAAAAGAMVGIATNGAYAIWYGFPLDYTAMRAAIVFVAFLAAGAVIAWILPGPKQHAGSA